MQRAGGIIFGIATQALFLGTVWQLFQFLHADAFEAPTSTFGGALIGDVGLALLFAVPHSLLLHPTSRKKYFSWVPRPFYGCFFCVVTCLSLLTLFAGWRAVEPVVWRVEGPAYAAIETLFFGSWIALFYSLYLSGLGYQTGLTPWWYWLRRQSEPARAMPTQSLYRFLRHPIYLSFLGLIWFNPVMTLDRFVLTLIWTAYIFVGSYLKDERLAFYLGARYRQYQSRVPGYPLMPFGPLARVRHGEARYGEPRSSSAASMVSPGPNASATHGPAAR